MKKIKFYVPALLGAIMVGFTACGSDDDEDEPGFVDVSNMTVTEQKEYIGSVAEEVSDLLAEPSVKSSVEFLDYLSERYGGYDDDDYYRSRVRRIGRSYDLIQFADVKGTYRWNGDEFVKVGDSNDFTAIIPNDPVYKEIVIKVNASNDGDIISVEDEEYPYDVKVPHSMTGSITANGKVMMTQNVKNSGLNGKTTTASGEVTMGALIVKADGQANPTNATATTTMTVGGVQIANANATLSGNNLTSYDQWQSDMDGEYFFPSKYVNSTTGRGNILNKLQIYTNATLSSKTDQVEGYYDYGSWGDYATKSAAQAACKKDCDILNGAISGYVCFNNTDVRQAYITFIPWLDDDYYGEEYGYYEIMPAIRFADGSTYSDEMFEGVFDKALNQWGFLFR